MEFLFDFRKYILCVSVFYFIFRKPILFDYICEAFLSLALHKSKLLYLF